MDIRKVLVVRTSALGDIVHVLPALAALRQLYPKAFVGWLVEPGGAQLLAGHSGIDRLYVFDRARWKRQWRRPSSWPGLWRDLFRLIRAVRRERFDLVVDFQCNVRSGLAVLLSGGRRRLGFSRADCPEWGGYLFTNRKASRCPPRLHKVEKNIWLLRELGWTGDAPRAELPIPDEHRVWARGIVSSLEGRGPVVMVHPAVSRFGELKRWPTQRYRELIDLARAELDARVLITWGPGEQAIAEAIGRPTVSPPIESPLHLAALASCADVVVAADTGALHMASALSVPVVGIYGPKDERIYGPYPLSSAARVVRSGVPCSPCRLRRCEHRICMSLVFAEDVLQALRESLREPPSTPR